MAHTKGTKRVGNYKTKHGMYGTKVHLAWRNAKSRCYNPRNVNYINYGGRGITMYQPWRDDLLAFYEEVGDPPSHEHTLDRIDVNKNYEPGNVRWVTAAEQQKNKRTNVVITWRNKTMILKDWAKEFGVTYSCLALRVKRWGYEAVFDQIERGIFRLPKEFYRSINCKLESDI